MSDKDDNKNGNWLPRHRAHLIREGDTLPVNEATGKQVRGIDFMSFMKALLDLAIEAVEANGYKPDAENVASACVLLIGMGQPDSELHSIYVSAMAAEFGRRGLHPTEEQFKRAMDGFNQMVVDSGSPQSGNWDDFKTHGKSGERE